MPVETGVWDNKERCIGSLWGDQHYELEYNCGRGVTAIYAPFQTGKVGESVWRKYFLPSGRSRMGGQLGLMLPTRRRRSQWWEPFLCSAPPRWISAWWLCYRNADPTLEQNHHQRATNAVSTFLHIQHQFSHHFHHHHNLHPTHHNSHLCHHICHIINITRYQST